jgi:uncharacterized membrane protein
MVVAPPSVPVVTTTLVMVEGALEVITPWLLVVATKTELEKVVL